jgi:hypothetical protein
MNKIPQEGISVVTPEDAAYWLETHRYEHQRSLRVCHSANLTKEVLAGRFKQKTQIAFCRLGDKYMLTNGQHTLTAIKNANRPWLLSIVIHETRSMEEVADIYAMEDTHLTRKFADSLVAHEEHIRLGVTVTEMSWIAAACGFYAFMIGEIPSRSTTSLTHSEKLLLTRKHGELAVSALKITVAPNSSKSGFMNRKTTLAPMMFVYNKSPDMCYQFYGEMFADDGLRIGDPRKTLLDFFRDSVTIGGAFSSFKQKRALSDHHFIKAQASAYNAFVDRRNLKHIKIDHESKEAVFKGIGTVRV